ncbi:MAG: hypothetical protein HDR08_07050 [Lachnospiraceae bacterium]|nr:hypothetical protein [Lachnospiraceae bacterium]
MVEDLSLVKDYSILEKRKNIICGSKDYVRKAGKLLVRAHIAIEKIYCDDEITDDELQNIEKTAFSDIFVLDSIEKYNVIYAEKNQEQMEQGINQLDQNKKGHIYTYCGLYITLSIHADKNGHILEEMTCMNDMNMAMGTYDLAARWMRSLRWVEESGIPLILYAMPKTGTQAMKATLNQYGYEHTYVHFLNINTPLDKQFYHYYGEKIPCLAHLLHDSEYVKKYHLNVLKEKKIKIITSVREPIARNYSMIFQAIKNWGPYPLVRKSNGNFAQGVIDYLEYCSSSTWDWFEDEIKEVFGIDIFRYPFDKENGYCIIKTDKVEIFLYRLESSRKLGKALGEFLGAEKSIDMLTFHEASKEEYRFVYAQLKNEIQIPDAVISQYYDNDKMRHFYTEEEITDLKNKWKR